MGHRSAVATLISLLLVSVAVALIVLVVTAMPHLQSGDPLLSAEAEQKARRGLGRVLSWVPVVFTVIGNAVGSGMDALRNGPASGRRPPVGQHGPSPEAWTGEPAVPEPTDTGQQSLIGPRHASR